MPLKIQILIILLLAACLKANAAPPFLLSSSPSVNENNIDPSSNIVLNFSELMSELSVDQNTASVLDDNIQIRSVLSGWVDGTWSGDGSNTLTFSSTNDFTITGANNPFVSRYQSDINGDGAVDLITTNRETHEMTVFLNEPIKTFYSQSTGTFNVTTR